MTGCSPSLLRQLPFPGAWKYFLSSSWTSRTCLLHPHVESWHSCSLMPGIGWLVRFLSSRRFESELYVWRTCFSYSPIPQICFYTPGFYESSQRKAIGLAPASRYSRCFKAIFHFHPSPHLIKRPSLSDVQTPDLKLELLPLLCHIDLR